MKKYIVAFGALVFPLVVLSCSQKGAVTSASSGRQGVRASAKVGDRAEYSLNFTTQIMTGNRSSIPAKVTGHKTVTVVASTNHGRSVPPQIVTTYDVRSDTQQQGRGGSRSRTTIAWCGEDSSGNVYLLGESQDGVKWDVVTDINPPIILPSKLKVGDSWSYVAHLSSGSTESYAMKCVGVERLRTPAGEYDTYKVGRTGTHSGVGVTLSGYAWLTLSLPLVFEVRVQQSSDLTLHGIPTRVVGENILQSVSLAR